MPPVRKAKPTPAVQPTASESKEPRAVVSGQLDKRIKKQTERKEQKEAQKRGVVFIKHLPHGFFEEQLKNYFQQFGKVTRLRLCRSRRTGGSKGFAFVEFEYPEVAQVAAETMDNYLMFKKVVKAAYIPPEKQCFNYFKTHVRKVKNKAGQDIYVSHKTAAIQRKMKEHNDWSEDNYQKRTAKSLQKLKKLNKKYAHLGIDFSKLVVFPKKASQDDKSEAAETAAKVEDTPVTSSKTKKSKATKRKQPVEESSAKLAKASKKQTKKSDPELADLLGNTINDDSEDEEYIAMPDSDDDDEEYDDIDESAEEQLNEGDSDDDTEEEEDDDTSSDEETYGFTKDSDDDGEVDIKQSKQTKNKKATKQTFSKSLKAPKVDRLEQRIKRKPHTGAIQKAKKPVKAAVAAKTAKTTKNQLQLTAAKEMAKTLKAKPKVPPTKLGKKSKLRK